MRTIDIIAAKRDGRELVAEDIYGIVLDYACGRIPDYQMSAFLMAVYLRGLSFEETSVLTRAMIDSGNKLDLSSIIGTKVDKHSTGGVGDKTTLVVIPILAAMGLKSPKMSGRGLGFTGGTLDKLESIPGFDTALSVTDIIHQVNEIGAAIAGQTEDIVPADKKIYALRDVTATVGSVPLICASVMSKKLACSADVIMLDVKTGSGAFAKDIQTARELASSMITIGRSFGRTVGAAITDMNQPLGAAVGNALEVVEAIDTLKGDGPDDLRLLSIDLSARIVQMSGLCSDADEAKKLAVEALDSGRALDLFRAILRSQKGDPAVIEDYSILPQAKIKHEVIIDQAGFVSAIEVDKIGIAASILGAGREKKDDIIDPAVGLMIHKKLGDPVAPNEPIATIYANDPAKLLPATETIRRAYTIAKAPTPAQPLIHEHLEA